MRILLRLCATSRIILRDGTACKKRDSIAVQGKRTVTDGRPAKTWWDKVQCKICIRLLAALRCEHAGPHALPPRHRQCLRTTTASHTVNADEITWKMFDQLETEPNLQTRVH